MMLLFIAHVIIHAMWRYKIDPDTSAIPYLTALGDLFGSSLLLGAFAFLRFVGHEYEGRGPPTPADLDVTSPISLLLSAVGGN
jgi:solute carrier family 41